MSTTAHAVGFSFVERLAQDLRDERLELPAFPEAVIRIQRVLQSPDTSTDDIVRILRRSSKVGACPKSCSTPSSIKTISRAPTKVTCR